MDSPLPTPPPIDWSKAGTVIPVHSKDAESGEPEDGERQKDDEAYQDTWEDWALCLGAELMAELRSEVFAKLKYTCSAGISHGKAMAKVILPGLAPVQTSRRLTHEQLSAGYKKPNNQTVLRSAATAGFLRDMDFTEIRMLGGKLGTAIAEQFQVKTVGDLLCVQWLREPP